MSAIGSPFDGKWTSSNLRTVERLVSNGIAASNGVREKGTIRWTRLSCRAIIPSSGNVG
jgi:hypothetical protein